MKFTFKHNLVGLRHTVSDTVASQAHGYMYIVVTCMGLESENELDKLVVDQNSM